MSDDRISNNLLFPNQLRMNGVVVNECPVHMEKKPNNKSHGLIFLEKNDLKLSLEMSGVMPDNGGTRYLRKS
jgi:hypothetical protein